LTQTYLLFILSFKFCKVVIAMREEKGDKEENFSCPQSSWDVELLFEYGFQITAMRKNNKQQ
jgi:hypothetical protein